MKFYNEHETTKVYNEFGVEFDLDAAAVLMDDDIREEIVRIGVDSDQEFFDKYAEAHEKKYGEPWELSKPNPCW